MLRDIFFKCVNLVFQVVFVNFSVSFQYFIKRFSALKYYEYKCVSSVECIKLMTIIGAEMGNTPEGQLYIIDFLRYRHLK